MSREVPEGWQLGKLGSFVEEFKVLDSAGDLPPLSVTKSSGIVFQSDKFNKRIANASSGNYKVIKNGEYSYDPMSLYYGAIGRLKVCDAGIVSPAYITFRLKGALDTAFFDLYVKTGDFLVQVNKVTTGGNQDGKRKKTDWNSFCSLPIALPPLHEQRRIAEILSGVDVSIAATRAVIEQTRKVKRSVLERLLTKGIGHTRFKQTEIGEIPEGWNIVRLNHVAERTTYGFTNPMSTVDNGPWMITAANIQDGKINYNSARRTDRIEFETLLSEKSKPAINTVLITKDGTLGRVAIVDKDDICINQSVAAVIPMETEIRPRFLYWLLQSPSVQDRILSEAGGSTIKHIYISKLADTVLQLPSKSEQDEITGHIDMVELTYECERKHLDALLNTKSALMSDLLTGRKRVTETLLLAAE